MCTVLVSNQCWQSTLKSNINNGGLGSQVSVKSNINNGGLQIKRHKTEILIISVDLSYYDHRFINGLNTNFPKCNFMA